MKSLTLGVLSLVMGLSVQACAQAPRDQAPGYAGVSAGSATRDFEVYAPSKDFEELSPAVEDEGLFLQAAQTTQQPAVIQAQGGGYYQNTSQGYQYYNANNQATSWFGQPNASTGQWALTQGTYQNNAYSFANQPSLLMGKGQTAGTWNGTWQQYDAANKKWGSLPGTSDNYSTLVNYNAAAGAKNPWQTAIVDKNSADTFVRYNSWLPTGQGQYVAGGKVQSAAPDLFQQATLNAQGTRVPTTQSVADFFTKLGVDPFATGS